nr:MAG TPA: hypothetical protein [Caudoviricetes sp.]
MTFLLFLLLSNRATFQKTFFTLKGVRLWQQKAEKTL